jgi:hypothetical protein
MKQMEELIIHKHFFCTRFLCGNKAESINVLSLFYFACTLAFVAIGCYFFTLGHKDPLISPAESRNLNSPCVLLIYDNHDIWHFLSAIGLFFMLMMMLTIEDKNMDTSWDDIPVF